MVLGILKIAHETLEYFYVTVTGYFERFQSFNYEKSFLKSQNFFQKTGVPFFGLKYRLKGQHFHTKVPCQKPVLKARSQVGDNFWRLKAL